MQIRTDRVCFQELAITAAPWGSLGSVANDPISDI